MFGNLLESFREKEVGLIQRILKRGVETDEFAIRDIPRHAHLFVLLLQGLRMLQISKQSTVKLDKPDYDELEKNLKDFTTVFVKGISKN